MTAYIIRIQSTPIRCLLVTLAFPLLLLGLGAMILRHKPSDLFRARPWDNAATLYWMACDGAFVGTPVVRESAAR